MFRRSKDFPDTVRERSDYSSRDDYFGDEDGTARAASIEMLDGRVAQIEAQMTSQFTSLATYSQIAQEHTELVRSEARHETERNTARVITLVEQERADRLAAAPDTDLAERVDAIETQLTEIHTMLQECLANQNTLVDTVAELVAQPPTDEPLSAPPARASRVRLALA